MLGWDFGVGVFVIWLVIGDSLAVLYGVLMFFDIRY